MNTLKQRAAAFADIEALPVITHPPHKTALKDIFRRHNLNKLAEAKPGLIESRINKGTAAVFGDIENDSKELSNLSNPNNPD